MLSDTASCAYSGALPADILILARPLHGLRIGDLLGAVRPHEIILAQKPSSYALRRWKDSCAAYQVTLYNVTGEGALVLQ